MTIVNTAKNMTSTLCIASALFISGCYGDPETETTTAESETVIEQETILDQSKVAESKTAEAR